MLKGITHCSRSIFNYKRAWFNEKLKYMLFFKHYKMWSIKTSSPTTSLSRKKCKGQKEPLLELQRFSVMSQTGSWRFIKLRGTFVPGEVLLTETIKPLADQFNGIWYKRRDHKRSLVLRCETGPRTSQRFGMFSTTKWCLLYLLPVSLVFSFYLDLSLYTTDIPPKIIILIDSCWPLRSWEFQQN